MLPITRTVVDETVRENLQLEDDRDLASRENRLVSIVATGEKTVIYVNSRDQSVALAKTLRNVCPIAQPISRSITRGLRAPIAAAWRKHSGDGSLQLHCFDLCLWRGRQPARYPPCCALPHAVWRHRVQPDEADVPAAMASPP